jgi:hypothetical protein
MSKRPLEEIFTFVVLAVFVFALYAFLRFAGWIGNDDEARTAPPRAQLKGMTNE